MILVGIGANLPLNNNEAPRSTCGAALEKLQKAGIKILKRSAWYKSAPVPISNAPWYVNGVVEIETELSPSELLFCFHKIEAELGRDRPFLNAPRTLDLDILTYHEQSISPDQSSSSNLTIPHPRMHQRAFVLIPLKDLNPNWIHPTLEMPIESLIKSLPDDQQVIKMDDAKGFFGTEWDL